MPPPKSPLVQKLSYVMPKAPAVVAWYNAPGVAPSYAIVTAYGRTSLNVMVFPPDSRIGIPKDGVRHLSDPIHVKQGINADSGAWDYTAEDREISALKLTVAELVLAKIK